MSRQVKQLLPVHRNPEKLAAVKQELDQHAKQGTTIHTYTSDFSSLVDIRKLADKVKADHASIDVLINNAGIFSNERQVSKDGIELTWAVNALAPFLLTSLLLDRVKDRIVNVGSMALADKIDLNNLEQVQPSPYRLQCTSSKPDGPTADVCCQTYRNLMVQTILA